ncbi:MAG TPA: SDR family oxidoreductase, partial [Methylovirgula sp.]
ELRAMLPKGSGVVVNVSSAYGHEGAAGASVYVASKHAVEGLTKSAALETATTGVRVVAVAPGPITTGMLERFTGDANGMAAIAASVPMKRVGLVENIADAIVFISSPKAAYITGTVLSVDGGMAAA